MKMGMNKTDIYHRPMYTIGVVAELAGVHPQTLRAYEQKGLVTPTRSGGNTRLYSQADIDRLMLINELTDEGINLAGVLRIITLQNKLDDAETALAESEKQLNELHGKIKRLTSHFKQLSGTTDEPFDPNNMAIVLKKTYKLN